MKDLKRKKKNRKEKAQKEEYDELSGTSLVKLKNETKFEISSLNQEKVLNELSKTVALFEIDRKTKNDTTFKCSYFDYKKVAKILKSKNVKVEKVTHDGVAFKLKKALTCWGLLAGAMMATVLYFLQAGFVLQYEVTGLAKLTQTEVVEFVKGSFPRSKSQIDTKAVEVGLVDNFHEISFASCILRGQTMVINIKEKLLPDEMYGDFAPLKAQKDGKITQIDLISGTLCVKVGDFVRAGDTLVEPYTIDTSGQMKKVEAKAEIRADVYNEGSAEHFEKLIEIKRTGKTIMQNEITLFGLVIYTFKEDNNFKMYEVETEKVNLVKNLFLPFKMKKTYIYETEEIVTESSFEDVKEQFVAKAKEKALENCADYGKMKEEFYTVRELSGVTIVNFCIVTEEIIGSVSNAN